MEIKNIFSIILSITVFLGVFFTLSSAGIINVKGITTESKIEIKSKESFEKGEKALFEVNAESSFLIKKIVYLSPEKTKEKECSKTECSVEFTEIFQKTGVYMIEMKMILDNGNQINKKKKITVIETEKKCIDGTLFGECSKQKPNYCNNGKLEKNCEKCGCNEGECINGKCIHQETFEIKRISIEKKFVKPNQKISLIVDAEKIPAKEFNFIVEWIKNNSTQKTQKITKNLCSSCSKIFSAELTAPEKEGEYIIEIKNTGKVFEITGIKVKNDSIAPSAPTGITARKTDGKILIAWNANPEEDLKEYRIYRSKEDSQAFTAYVLNAVSSKEETGKELELWQTNYFYLTAVDWYGNESNPSAITKAT